MPMPPLLSVNVNKVATLRNARGGRVPSVVRAAEVCVEAGARGITVHPRADQRHIRPQDVYDLDRRRQQSDWSHVEFNIEGDPRPDWVALVRQVRPTQATLVPVRPGEVTSEAGWDDNADVSGVVSELRGLGIRVSLFVDATPASIPWAARMGADRVELYTEPFAQAFARGEGERAMVGLRETAAAAAAVGLGINAGHDLDLDNLVLLRDLPHLAEVSIGHALMADALFVGLERAVRAYLSALAPG